MAYLDCGTYRVGLLAARFWRLVPTFVLCAILTALVEHVMADVNLERMQSLRSCFYNLGCPFNGNLLCDLMSAVTLDRPVRYRSVDGVYWSLQVEICFCLLIWFLLYVVKTRHAAAAVALMGLIAPLNLEIPLLSKGRDYFLYLSFFAFGLACRRAREDRRLWFVAALAVAVFRENALHRSAGISTGLDRRNMLSYAICFALFLGVVHFYRHLPRQTVPIA